MVAIFGAGLDRSTTSTKPAYSRKRKTKPPVDPKRLCKVIQNDYHDLMPFRSRRTAAVRQLVGSNYGDNGTVLEMPFNLLAIWAETVLNATVANQPQVMYTTENPKQEAAVDAYQAWANPELTAMDAAGVFRRVIADSLFWVGILRCTLATPIDAEQSGWGMQAGQPFMRSIDPDDWCCDQGARTWDTVAYAACRYRVAVDLAEDIYNQEFEADEQTDYNYGGDEKIRTIGRTPGYREEIEDHCTIWEVWLPKHKQILLLRDNGGIPDGDADPVAVINWIGPSRGPYHYLSMFTPPGNLNPNGPANQLTVMNQNLNSAWRKLLRQTRDYKKQTVYRGTATKDAERVRRGIDGEMVMVEDPDSIREYESGGAANAVWVMAQAMQQAFNFLAGNMALLSGRGAQSKTATQDKLLADNASASVASIQDRTYAFMARALETWNWFCWHHPQKEMKSQWQSQSFPELKVNRSLAPAGAGTGLTRDGSMPKMKIDVYSLSRQTPQSRLAFINSVLQGLAPMQQVFMSQGVMMDANAIIEIFSELGSEPKLKKIFRYVAPPEPEGSSDSMAAGKPANTTRTYNRYGAGDDSDAAESADINEQFGQLQSGSVNPNSELQAA